MSLLSKWVLKVLVECLVLSLKLLKLMLKLLRPLIIAIGPFEGGGADNY